MARASYDNYIDLEVADYTRRHLVLKTIKDLFDAAIQSGQTDVQAEAKIDELFTTYAAEWSIYILAGVPAIITSIQNDATMPWLDTDVAGVTIRQRLINRLS